jgi:hypothetical protein
MERELNHVHVHLRALKEEAAPSRNNAAGFWFD